MGRVPPANHEKKENGRMIILQMAIEHRRTCDHAIPKRSTIYQKHALSLSQIFEAEYPSQKARRHEGHILRRQTQVDVQTTLINDLEQKA